MPQERYLHYLIRTILERTPDADDDDVLLDMVFERLPREKRNKVKQGLYIIVSKLALKTRSGEALEFLLQRLETETDKYVLMYMLDGIGALPMAPSTHLSPILKHTHDRRWQVRHSAIAALGGKTDETAEGRLIEILNTSEDPFDLAYANSTLNRIGTRRALPAIEPHLKCRKQDVKHTAKLAIEAILTRHQT